MEDILKALHLRVARLGARVVVPMPGLDKKFKDKFNYHPHKIYYHWPNFPEESKRELYCVKMDGNKTKMFKPIYEVSEWMNDVLRTKSPEIETVQVGKDDGTCDLEFIDKKLLLVDQTPAAPGPTEVYQVVAFEFEPEAPVFVLPKQAERTRRYHPPRFERSNSPEY